MEFRICPVYNPKIEITQECLDKHLLKIVGMGYFYPVKFDDKEINLR
jgi:hypothetical protein